MLSVAQAKEFDQLAQNEYGLPSIVLMENAGRSVAEEALEILGRKKHIAVVCGLGNNGGDGLVAARQLINAGKRVQLFVIGEVKKFKNDPLINFRILQKMGLAIKLVKQVKDLKAIKGTNLIIDAIFGIGLDRPVQGLAAQAINEINRAKKPVLAVDVPSGLNADSGQVMKTAVKAKVTVTFIAIKRGMKKNSGPGLCGRIIVRDIGIRGR